MVDEVMRKKRIPTIVSMLKSPAITRTLLIFASVFLRYFKAV